MKLSNLNEDLNSICILGKGNKERVIPLAKITKKILSQYLSSSHYLKSKLSLGTHGFSLQERVISQTGLLL